MQPETRLNYRTPSDKGSLESLGALRVPTTKASSTMTKKSMAQEADGT
jgi:hypothetical protein